MKFLLVNIVIWWGKLNFGRGNRNLVGGESSGGIFPGREGIEQIFASEGTPPSSPQ